MSQNEALDSTKENLKLAFEKERKQFHDTYSWLEGSMPANFFEEISQDNIMLITHNLMGFPLQDYFSSIHLKNGAIVLCLDSPDADLRVLENYALYGIKNYQVFISNTPPPYEGISTRLRVASIHFTEAFEAREAPLPEETVQKLRSMLKRRLPKFSDNEIGEMIDATSTRFQRALKIDSLILALEMYGRAKTRDNCQYEIRYNENWEENDLASMQIILAWRNIPKYNFLYRIARVIHRQNLVIRKVNATYIDPFSNESILIMVLDLHGIDGRPVWDVADIPDFIRELVTVKYFAAFDAIDEKLIKTGLISGTLGNFLRAAVNFIHQGLVHIDPYLYTIENIEKDLCKHPELTGQIAQAFKTKFDPDFTDFNRFLEIREQFLIDVAKLDTGNEENDKRRKNVLRLGMNLVHYTLKTNYYRLNYTAISFRLNPKYLDEIPFDREKKFPELPYAIFYIKGMHFFGFHVRFKDLARGGLRSIYPDQPEKASTEANSVFTECYNLAYTQQLKNKDIPEGGAKGTLILRPHERVESESAILKKELEVAGITPEEITKRIEDFKAEQKLEFLYQAQRSYIESLITIVNCEPDGKIRAKYIIDYWKKPEYIYIGPDENLHNTMIQWIADFSKKYGYRPGSAFMSGKPQLGINHKEYGVTSLGLNVYMEAVLKYLGFQPERDIFTVKISGGPDGDVAGNQIHNLFKFYPKTAKVLSLTDISGTIHDPGGLDLRVLVDLFHQAKPIKYYPPEKLNSGGFLLDKGTKREKTAYMKQFLCWRNANGELVQDWLSGSEMNQLMRYNVHKTIADIFIPAGGRPRTLQLANYKEFLDETGKPTAKAIVEGANLYLTHDARRKLEELGVLIIKDSSANKTGVICSSFEILSGITLGDEKFLEKKEDLVKEILERLKICAANEANLLLSTHRETGEFLTTISDKISHRINYFTYSLLDYLDTIPLSDDPEDPMVQAFLGYCPPTLRNEFSDLLLKEVPEHHKKAVIACYIGAQVVYKRGMSWFPSIVDILPLLLSQKELLP